MIENPYYPIYNNLTSLYVAKEYLGDSYITEGDIYIAKNIFDKEIIHSTYFSCNRNTTATNEWALQFNSKNLLQNMSIGNKSGDYILSGVSFWNQSACKKIYDYLCKLELTSKNKNLYWDHIILEHLSDFEIYVTCLSETALYEIDTIDDYYHLQALLCTKSKEQTQLINSRSI